MFMNAYFRLMRLDKPIGIFLLLWPTLWALWLANKGSPPLSVLIVFCLGTLIMRSAGCIINDIADRKLDGKVKRTASRPLVTGEVSLNRAILLFIALLCIACGLLCCLDVPLFKVATIGAGLAVIYPFCKRFLATPQLILGFAFSWGIPLAFLSAHKPIDMAVILLMLLNFLWIICYDTYYAMVDKDDDIKIGIHSTALFWGSWSRLIIAGLQLLIAFLWLYLAGIFNLSYFFYIFWFMAHLLFIYQFYLTSEETREQCFEAFLNNHWYGLFILIGIIIGQ